MDYCHSVFVRITRNLICRFGVFGKNPHYTGKWFRSGFACRHTSACIVLHCHTLPSWLLMWKFEDAFILLKPWIPWYWLYWLHMVVSDWALPVAATWNVLPSAVRAALSVAFGWNVLFFSRHFLVTDLTLQLAYLYCALNSYKYDGTLISTQQE